MPQNPTVIWLLGTAVGGLATALVYLYKQLEKERRRADGQRDKHEAIQLESQRELRELLEKTLVAFGEVDRTLLEVVTGSGKEIIKTILENRKEIIDEIKDHIRHLKYP